MNFIMKKVSLLPFNHQRPKEIFINKVIPQLERKGEIIVSKFQKFCFMFFDEQNESLNIEDFPSKNDSILEERIFTWEIIEESRNDNERKNKNNIISEFIVKILKNISQGIILFFEFDEVFLGDVIISVTPDNNSFVKDDLKKNFKLHEHTNSISVNLIYFVDHIFSITQNSLNLIKPNATRKFKNTISNIIIKINLKLERLHLIDKPNINKRNYDMRFN